MFSLTSWTPKVCKMMALWVTVRGFGLQLDILLGSRKGGSDFEGLQFNSGLRFAWEDERCSGEAVWQGANGLSGWCICSLFRSSFCGILHDHHKEFLRKTIHFSWHGANGLSGWCICSLFRSSFCVSLHDHHKEFLRQAIHFS